MKKNRKIIFTVIIVLTVFVLVAGFYFVQASGNRRQAFHTGGLLIEQIEAMLVRNARQEASLKEGYKDDYITRAKAVAYIIDHEPPIGADSNELRKIAKLVSVDEIYLFDVGGTIYNGTNTKFIGTNMDA
ncbi:MAG: GGDEF domain-containing protein, partial [Lachnospiraceae bacterium]|nr:GGDEF domain-containing protein [Lachnospiraceae bacterium]